jgi:hypothetical protein
MITHKDGTISHIGLVLDIRETESFSMDSYTKRVFAIVYNEETQETEEITLAGVYIDSVWKDKDATIDAPQALKDLVKAKEQAKIDAIEARTIRKGKKIQVNGGRKYKGLVGVVFWEGQCKFNRHKTNLGVKTSDGQTFFVDKYFCEVYRSELEKVLK